MVSSNAQSQIRADYQQILGRDADPAGLAAWEQAVAQGATPDQVRSGMAHSAEAADDTVEF